MSCGRNTTIVAWSIWMVLATLAAGQDRAGPFTKPTRSVRTRTIDQQHIRLELRFDWEKQEMKGRAIHSLALLQPQNQIVLDAAEMNVGQVQLLDAAGKESSKLNHRQHDHSLTIELGRAYAAGDKLQLAIDYVVTRPNRGAHFVTPDAHEPNQPKMVWTQSEPEQARYWFPCLDNPADRITSEIVATVPKSMVVLSNGQLEGKTDNADQTTTWRWVQAKTHVPYLMSVVAGDFEILQQTWDGIPVQSYVPRGRLADAPRSFAKTGAMVQFFSEKIGYRYPWPKYAQICVDEYGWGGMEHTSATTLNLGTLHDERADLDVSSIELVAHELAHQWWGDMLTCKDWGELWLNESFATYFATLWQEHDEGADEAAWDRRNDAESYFGEDARYRRPIVTYRYNDPENMFDGHSYPKGGRVLHMLRWELGDEAFWRAIRRYAEVNQFRAVETADLRIAIEEATGQGMNWFFDQWLHHGGHPEYAVDWSWDAANKDVRITIKQTQPVDAMTPLFRATVELEIALPGETISRRVVVSKAEETFHFPAALRPTRVCFDPADAILKKLSFPKSKEELLDQLARDQHLICRVQAVAGLAEFKDQGDALDALIATAEKDAFWAVRQEAVKLLAKTTGDKTRAALIRSAKSDTKSFVRREAVIALGAFAHDESRAAARAVIASDKSYYAVAEALRLLVKIDRDHCREALLAALDQPSHNEVILRAACDGLIELKEPSLGDKLQAMLRGAISPDRRIELIGALARQSAGRDDALKLLHAQLDNERAFVRRKAIDAIAEVGHTASISELQARRLKEQHPSARNSLDAALAKVRAKNRTQEEMRKEMEALRKKNEDLEQRLKKLEAGGKP